MASRHDVPLFPVLGAGQYLLTLCSPGTGSRKCGHGARRAGVMKIQAAQAFAAAFFAALSAVDGAGAV